MSILSRSIAISPTSSTPLNSKGFPLLLIFDSESDSSDPREMRRKNYSRRRLSKIRGSRPRNPVTVTTSTRITSCRDVFKTSKGR
ncbi:hypothetical protein M569_03390 [Genlisea aurea]|uniref:Uncharacterized protein n=1 Tax=Genlisea aurea TaxID=192259 RepID=S8CVI5_9LAMI|nr:hypothetical protein M569_03390 [Genlisea aurea]